MSELFDRILLLKKSPTFSQVKTEDLKAVAQSLEEETYLAGERVFDIDEYGDCMYILQKGKIGISLHKDINKNNKNFIAELSEGECFGEMNLLDDLPRSATAYVLEDSVLLSLEKPRLRGLIINYPEFGFFPRGLHVRNSFDPRHYYIVFSTVGRPVFHFDFDAVPACRGILRGVDIGYEYAFDRFVFSLQRPVLLFVQAYQESVVRGVYVHGVYLFVFF